MGINLRFNDLMNTVLAAGERSGLGAVTLWRQCVDMLAQHDRPDRAGLPEEDRAALLKRLEGLRSALTETQRMASVVELGSRLRSPTLVTFFAQDRASISAAAMARAQLPDAVWPDLMSRLTPTARGVLRARRGLGPETLRALEAFGSADLVLTTDVEHIVEMDLTAEMMVQPGVHSIAEARAERPTRAPLIDAEPAIVTPLVPADQIRNLVDRIERFTSSRRPFESSPDEAGDAEEAASFASPDTVAPIEVVRSFTFETDVSGTIIWVGEGPRAALIGLSLGETAPEGGSGPDGHVAGAFARRSGFQNARYTIVGGTMAGEWRMSAIPFFEPRSGRFQGFRGQARRPHMHEVAPAPSNSQGVLAGLSPDSLRQLVHELRTPLNAILGFAEIIEQQLFGPADESYRSMAGKIAVDARHLLAAFDDLDLAARVSRGEEGSEPRPVDPSLLVAQVAARFRGEAQSSARMIDIVSAPDLPDVRIDPVQGERMVQHLLRTLISVAPAEEPITGTCWFSSSAARDRVVLAIDRPSSLAGMEEAQLLDPGYLPDGEWADGPLLGLGFSLRLIRSLATGSGGSLAIDANRFLLAMPAVVGSQGDEVGQA
ncbi:HAMP domain-containing sensor histidine kinase [Sphingobium aromaticiconvertens]|uniref:sensor histidine kinase n=1 Tax=Sphingobium aromaticiconvertens TaxID=365341 RepID=UPI0030189F6F